MTFPDRVDVAETHVSVLFFVGDRVYKFKKPVRFGFLDFSTPELRAHACRREVALNRRIAPDAYLGVAEIRGPERGAVEHCVVMRRMPSERRLSTLVSEGADVDDDVRQLARVIAAFHAETATSPSIADAASPDRLRDRWDRTFTELKPFVGRIVDAGLVAPILSGAERYLAGRGPLFSWRQDERRVREGHGDLRAEDVFCLADGPRVLDCIEFDDSLRHVDVLDDVCFLAMDLERLGAPDLAARFLGWWREFSGGTYPTSLADHYIAYRAMVRVKVACLRASQGHLPSVDEAQALLRLATRHIERGRVRLVLVGGLPGTGKSTLADALGRERGWTVLRSDVRRKELMGVPASAHASERFGEGIYTSDATNLTYAELLGEAREALRLGESVVLDASWTDASWRRAARLVAHTTSSDILELQCTASRAVAMERVRHRSPEDPSDATPAVAQAMSRRADAWPEAIDVDTSGSRESALEHALNVIS